MPSVEISNSGVADFLAIYEWHPNRKKLNPYFNTQLLSSWFLNNGDHALSSAFLKLGVSIGSIRFGPAFNYQILNKQSQQQNWGAFLGVTL